MIQHGGKELDAARTSLTALGGGGTTELMTRVEEQLRTRALGAARPAARRAPTCRSAQASGEVAGSTQAMRMQKRGPGHASACVFGICARVAEIA
jgi:hypothetical protein